MRMIRTFAATALLTALAGCADPPRDPAQTTERVRDSGIVRLGVIAGAPPDARANAAVASVARALGARVERREDHTEELLEALELGELDLVYGHFSDASPWATRVHFGDPPGWGRKAGATETAPRFAFRNGENGWIMRVEGAGDAQ